MCRPCAIQWTSVDEGGTGPAPTCACKRALSVGWKSPSGLRHGPETERNCVAVMRGGEQREVNDQSAG